MPPVFRGDEVLVDGAAINNLPVDIMQRHAPGLVIGCDVGADYSFSANAAAADGPPLWRFFARSRSGKRRINIFQILMHAGMVNSVSSAAAQRALADVMLKPPLANIDLLNWHAFDRAIEAGYDYACRALENCRACRASPPAATERRGVSSLAAELENDAAAMAPVWTGRGSAGLASLSTHSSSSGQYSARLSG